MADEIIKVLDYILSSPELRVIGIIYLLFFFVIVLTMILDIFGITIKRFRDFDNHFKL